MNCAIVERTRGPAVEKIVLRFGLRFVLQNATSVPAAASLRMPRYFKDVARIPRLGLRKKCRGGTTEDSAGSTNGLIRRCLRCRRPATLKMTARRRRKSEGGSADGMEKKKALRLEGLSFWESGADLLSRGIPRTIIGAAPFHGPVRDGKAWFQSALGTRHSSEFHRSPHGGDETNSSKEAGWDCISSVTLAVFQNSPKVIGSSRTGN